MMFSLHSKSASGGRLGKVLSPALIFMVSSMIVNAGNYGYNVWLGRTVGPEIFAETGLLVNLLLLLSFLGMTFQVVSAKYIVDLDNAAKETFSGWLTSVSMLLGVLFATLLWWGAAGLSEFFQLSSSWVVKSFTLGIPFYFLLSVQRGLVQGKEKFVPLSASYQVEMLGRFVLTVLLLLVFRLPAGIAVALGIALSIIIASLSSGRVSLRLRWSGLGKDRKPILYFFLFTAGYEAVQIVINYFDILLVKHSFSPLEAGYYTSLSFIGRMIYFVTWMFVMLLLPDVINRRKKGKAYEHLLVRYVMYISLFVLCAVTTCYFFGDILVIIVFGEQYVAIGSYLWKYGLATGLFAIANVYCYYHLSLGNYQPVLITGALAIAQSVCLLGYHDSFHQVIDLQILFMGLALISQWIYQATKYDIKVPWEKEISSHLKKTSIH